MATCALSITHPEFLAAWYLSSTVIASTTAVTTTVVVGDDVGSPQIASKLFMVDAFFQNAIAQTLTLP